jgi:hypothetical protein
VPDPGRRCAEGRAAAHPATRARRRTMTPLAGWSSTIPRARSVGITRLITTTTIPPLPTDRRGARRRKRYIPPCLSFDSPEAPSIQSSRPAASRPRLGRRRTSASSMTGAGGGRLPRRAREPAELYDSYRSPPINDQVGGADRQSAPAVSLLRECSSDACDHLIRTHGAV